MQFNGRALIFTYSGTQVRIAEIERLQSLFKTSMVQVELYILNIKNLNSYKIESPLYSGRAIHIE